MENIIKFAKQYRKKKYLSNNPKSKYAFVGIGSHSINNLYPIINYLNLDLKYIVTQSTENAKLIDKRFLHIEGTTDINKVLEDKQIKGVFVSANPKSHFTLTKNILEKGKNVFVEKPPCISYDELKELIEIEKKSDGTCFVGLQKNYAPVNLELKKHIKSKCSYNYRFLTGAYPEGDPFLDLFIHPISLISFFFGEADLKFHTSISLSGGVTLFVNFSHYNGTTGVVELSTEYSWSNSLEKLIVNTEKGYFELTNTEELFFTPKQGLIFNIPKEKIFGDHRTIQILKKRNNFNPIFENNQLNTSGYYKEIECFVNYCEGRKYLNNSSLASLLNTYKIIDKLEK
jgi:virulence factor